jgi:hypothetical protein
VKVAGKVFGCRVEFIHPRAGGDPQTGVIVFQQVLNEVGA